MDEPRIGTTKHKLVLVAFFLAVGLVSALLAIGTIRVLDGVDEAVDEYAVESMARSVAPELPFEVEWDPVLFHGYGLEFELNSVSRRLPSSGVYSPVELRFEGVLYNRDPRSIETIEFEITYSDEDGDVVWTETWSPIGTTGESVPGEGETALVSVSSLDPNTANLEAVERLLLTVHRIDRGE